jgi:HNH endonuclease/AP2 domain
MASLSVQWCMAEIAMHRRDGTVAATFHVDDDDVPLVTRHKWQVRNGYVARSTRFPDGHRGALYLHRVLLGLQPGDSREVDHINRDKRDNRRANLRIVPGRFAQMQNMPGRGRSRLRGVSWHSQHGKWVAYATLNRKQHYLGIYADPEEAGRVAAEFRRQHMPHAVD